jgi:hypothetical protein
VFKVRQKLRDRPITSIILKARDSEELKHIFDLAQERSIHAVKFHDDGPIYKNDGLPVLTAISIGPVTPGMVYGITDYLPLWKEVGDSVG